MDCINIDQPNNVDSWRFFLGKPRKEKKNLKWGRVTMGVGIERSAVRRSPIRLIKKIWRKKQVERISKEMSIKSSTRNRTQVEERTERRPRIKSMVRYQERTFWEMIRCFYECPISSGCRWLLMVCLLWSLFPLAREPLLDTDGVSFGIWKNRWKNGFFKELAEWGECADLVVEVEV